MRASWLRVPFVAAAMFAVVLCAAVAGHAQTPTCAAIDADRVLPDATVCLRRAGIAVPASSPVRAANALFAHAAGRVAAGRFDDAARSLDCADAVLGANGDSLSRYELMRRRGILDYKRERIPQALSRFECALSLARAREDRGAIARDLKNIGTALRRLGDFHGALRSHMLSLELQRADGKVGGAVLNNIADVYRDLDEPEEAMRFYREALSTYKAEGDRTNAAHVLESMAEQGLDSGDVPQSVRWLDEALRTYRDVGNRAYELRAYGGLIRGALALGDIPRARAHVAAALAVATEHKLPLPASLQLQIARTARTTGDLATAKRHVRDGLAGVSDDDVERAALLDELAAIQESGGDRAAALDTLRRAHADALALSRAQNDRQLVWLRTRFETAERDRTISALESENRLRRAELRQRTLLLWLTLAIACAAAIAIWALLQRRRQRERLQEQARRVRQEEELARYRREADALAEDRSLLQALLDSREDAVCLLDADGHVLAANRAACALLAVETPMGHSVADHLAAGDGERLVSALERMEDSAAQSIDLIARAGAMLTARLSQWERGDGLIVLNLWSRTDATSPAAAPASPGDVDARRQADMREEFRRALVELMLTVVETWERVTASSRLELAEKSRIWRVTIDDGRLRARAMERYLSVSKLPHNPRWRDVLRSAYYVLGQCEMEPQAREDLQRRVDAVLAYTRRNALV
jgi:two-component system sensor histidine kinase ChiS